MGTESNIFTIDKNEMNRKLGSGVYGEVNKGTYNKTNTRAAVKIINLDAYFRKIDIRITEEQKKGLIDRIIERIKSMNILEGQSYENKNYASYLQETYLDQNDLYLGMELCNKNMIKYLNKPDIKARDIGLIYDVLLQLNNTFRIMKNKNILHGNIKLENILVNDENNKPIFKLSGFEIIPELIIFTKNKRPETICQYLPQEILEKKEFTIDQKTDLWSLGVIIYFLYFREFPFEGQSCRDVLEKTKRNKKKQTNFIELDNLIDRLLASDKNERLSWDDYFNHPFFQNNGFGKKYNIDNMIGEGPFSTVYKVKQKVNKKNYALKIYNLAKIDTLELNKNNQKDIRKEIKEKINQMERLNNDDENKFIKIYEQFNIEKGIAFIMELFECNLKDYILKSKDADDTDIFYFLVELNKSLKLLLQKNNLKIIGSLKLENILLNPSQNICKLSDVGFCPTLINLTKKTYRNKNIVYIAPELYNQNKYDSKCDLWSLGMMINFYFKKCFPYDADSFDDLINQIDSGQKKIGESNNIKLNHLLEALLEKDAKKRIGWKDYFSHYFFTNREYSKYYKTIGDALAEGAYYSIYKVKDKKTETEKVIKIIDKAKIRKKYKEEHLKLIDEGEIVRLVNLLVKQTEVMKTLEKGKDGFNENTVQFFEYFNTPKEFVIVMEKCESDLSHYFTHKKHGANFTEEEIRDLLIQLNNTFEIMVENNIIHGDLKLENILFIRKGNKLIYKLTDYGVSKEFLDLTEKFFDKSNPQFTAPEVLNGNKLEIKSDLWSLGVIIYTLFFREKPYKGKKNIEVFNNINAIGQTQLKTSDNPQFDHLIRRLLTVNLKDRLTWEQYFVHPFLAKGDCWKFYEGKTHLGDGPYYKVYKVIVKNSRSNEKAKDEEAAVKVIDLNKIRKGIENDLLRPCRSEDLKVYINDFIKETENMEILRGKNKDNINTVLLIDYFQTKDEFCIVQELCDGNLRELLEEKEKFSVKEIYQILTQLNNSFRILKENNLSHKDLRLEKILTKKNPKGNDYIYKLTGLEFSRKVDELLGISGITTNNKYKPPEILANEKAGETDLNLLSQKADLWSLGIIIFILYFGEFPFEGNNPNDVLNNIMRNENNRLNEINDIELKDLLKKLLIDEPEDRIDWNGYFKHKFFSKEKWKYEQFEK